MSDSNLQPWLRRAKFGLAQQTNHSHERLRPHLRSLSKVVEAPGYTVI
jgi:hypothetical protein